MEKADNFNAKENELLKEQKSLDEANITQKEVGAFFIV